MTVFGFVKVTVTGLNGAGSISAPGLKVNDRLLLSYSPLAPDLTGLEQIVSVDDHIYQNNTFDWSSHTFDLILIRGI